MQCFLTVSFLKMGIIIIIVINYNSLAIKHMIFFSRLAMRHDTCALIAVSLNLSQRTHPVVWSLSNLPFDCSQVLAVPKPIGEFD